MFAALVAWRYLTANRLQTALLIAGVALGVTAFVFITALVRGLANFQIAQTTGSIAHVVVEPPVRVAPVLIEPAGGVVTAAQPVSTRQLAQIRAWPKIVDLAAADPLTQAVSPLVTGNAFVVRGEAAAPVTIQGVTPENLDAISPISAFVIAGAADLSAGGLLIGATLAEDLGLQVGQPVLLRSDRGGERLFPVTGVYRTGLGSLDERVAFLAQRSARPLFDLPEGVNRIEIKLLEPDRALAVAERLRRATGLRVTPWQERNRQLQRALEGQGRTGSLIQIFALISILIGVASALLLSAYRRRAEIGIMRSFGVSRGFVAGVFVLQGLIVGLVGALVGCALGYGLCLALEPVKDSTGDQLLPLAPNEGGYVIVTVMTTLGSVLAALLPARAAARVDPVEAIAQ